MGILRVKALIWVLVLALAIPGVATAAGADKTTKYRVYQYDKPIMEFANYQEAVTFAGWYTNSRVEEIGSGAWKWNNYPRYQVQRLGQPVENGQFTKLEDAIREASRLTYASIRDMEDSGGWVWNNYPRYRVYQGDITLDNWIFETQNAAIAEAKKWAGAHIIDLSNNSWVWDNLKPSDKQSQRSGDPVYQVYQGAYTQDSWKFPYLEDAIGEALKWGNSFIVRIADQQTVYRNSKQYKVYQAEQLVEEFVSLEQALEHARQFANASIRLNGSSIWSNEAPYRVYQGEALIGEYFKLPEALYYASHYANSFIQRWDGKTLWNNFHKLQIWSWNGSASISTLAVQTEAVMGLDVDSPTWFILEDASGKLRDTSSKEAAALLRQRGFQIHPLVGNQFDTDMTSAFLANPDAQAKFISALVDKASLLQVDGINVDFESISGKDRQAFTAFITNLAAAAHEKQLKLSVDLPRGSVRWNHLSAFDHERLAEVVDYIITMTYDHHYSGSATPGSVAGLPWVEEGIQEFLAYGIPRDKLILGIPFYVREWTLNADGSIASSRSMYTKDLAALFAKENTVSAWDPAFQQYKVEYTGEDGRTRVFWLENEDTVKARLDLAHKYQLAGIAAWRLGQEDPVFWETILQNK